MSTSTPNSVTTSGTTPAAPVTNQQSFDRARGVLPGGVNSPVRAFGSVGGTPRFYVKAAGSYVTDVEGRSYIDLVNSWGPAILGHAHPEVIDAVQQAASRGLGFGASTPAETELAELVRARISVGGVSPIERLRLVSTGTEATMTAIRLARGATGRRLLVKFAGHYHGHSDGLLAEAGSGLATLSMPGSAGVTAETAAQTLVIEYNNIAALEQVFAEHGHDIAGVIFEAAAANMGVLAPQPGFNEAIVRIAHEHGALAISDEVLTGFRVDPAGYWGLDARAAAAANPEAPEARWVPDLFTFGKVIGGGMPLAALGGSARIMELLAPLGPVYQAGTLSGNPVAVAAGLATLRLADDAVYSRLNQVAETLSTETSAALSAEGVEHVVQHAGNLFSFVFSGTEPLNFADVKAQQGYRYAPFFHSMLDSGVSLPPSVFEAWFVSAAHDDGVVSKIVEALPAAAKAAAAASAPQ
ncbi:glutamate-1-semialdehyde 2,1-aminomutase [Salinibacterium sp. UTAS2018]|uniref:glutamate-1-semialdehyde 2,1-aminomutase n=1 Tax=Salinibacterium sp. UTAS2018 TaxID=2508880 RepID=UPI0010097711|nr:glutamate-1-semialdehyde 2,1-aminomutase [Salinibacterium sp. UTAS2018]QAV70731.1 glutamate-1-semialdehyde 2,1-aminomutase [Salinibacterium sp. UTAS2018]